MDKETKKEFNNLGRMVKRGFDDVDKRFDDVGKRFNDVDKRFDGFKQYVDKRFDTLEQGQEDIKLRLDQVAYRFELQDLEKRFEKRLRKVEFKLGLRKA